MAITIVTTTTIGTKNFDKPATRDGAEHDFCTISVSAFPILE